MPLKGDARQKINQINKKKGRSTSSPRTTSKSRSNKDGANRNIKDLRQIIKKKNPNRNEDRVATGRVTKGSSSGSRGSRDLRDTNRRLAARKQVSGKTSSRDRPPQISPAIAQEVVKAAWAAVSDYRKPHRTMAGGVGGTNVMSNSKKPQRQLYVPPHMKHQHSSNQEPRVIVLAPGASSRSNLAIDNHTYRNQPSEQGASVLISNLIPSITQSEIIELFGDIGTLTAVNMINQTTALVSYQNSSDAVRAVKVYNNRSLDGKPMYVNMMPSMSD